MPQLETTNCKSQRVSHGSTGMEVRRKLRAVREYRPSTQKKECNALASGNGLQLRLSATSGLALAACETSCRNEGEKRRLPNGQAARGFYSLALRSVAGPIF